MKSSAKKPATAKTKTDTVALLIATKKGGFILSSDNKRRKWDIKGPIFLGNIVHHMALDPREGRVMLMAAKTGHLGPTVFRSTNLGKTWKEASKPPAFAKAPEGRGRRRPCRRSRVLAHAGPRERAGCFNLLNGSSGAVPLGRRRRHLGIGHRVQRSSDAGEMDRRAWRRHA